MDQLPLKVIYEKRWPYQTVRVSMSVIWARLKLLEFDVGNVGWTETVRVRCW